MSEPFLIGEAMTGGYGKAGPDILHDCTVAVNPGEIAVIAGVDSIEVGDTICDCDHPERLPRIAIDPPTTGHTASDACGIIVAAALVGGFLHHRSWKLRAVRIVAYTIAGLGALYAYRHWYVGPKVEPDPFIASTYYGIKLAAISIAGALPGMLGGEVAVRLLRRGDR